MPNCLAPSACAVLLAAAPVFSGAVSTSPYAVESGKPSTVTVSGYSRYCLPIVSHRQVAVSGSTITLTAGYSDNPAADCIGGRPLPYKVDFDLPALKAGEYTVLQRVQPECAYSARPCPFAAVVDTGRLQVSDSLHYRIKPKEVRAGAAFKLRLIAPEFQCGSKFSNLSARIEGHRIDLRFTHEAHPEIPCTLAITEYGPVFDLSALDSGVYQVFATPFVPCTKPPCPLLAILPQSAGALTVGGTPGKVIWIEPGRVPAGMTVDVEVHSTGFTCNDVLTGKQTEVKDGAIRLRYSMIRNRKLCVDTTFVHWEAFSLPDLALGTYPVFLVPQDCPYSDSPLCTAGLRNLAVDTVTAESALGLRDRRKVIRGNDAPDPAASPRILWRGRARDLSGRLPPRR
ncbi:MAG TPA: hypothetical protein VJ385_12220 [Fibrobacteria bacterium]|nr:hypothetical protein [Fibrobacteria bacterium]